MTKTLLLATTLLGTTFLHAEHSKASIKLEHNKHEHAVHWGYKGENGPEHWGDIDPRFATCKNGVNQSPINYRYLYRVSLCLPLSLSGQCSGQTVVE